MTKLTDNKKETFLLFLSEGNTVTLAARAIGVSRQAIYKFRDNDDSFRKLWDEAIEEGTETLENVAINRGKLNSDVLLMFMLKARNPDKYRERIEVNVNWRQELRQSGIDPEQYFNQLVETARLQLEANADVIDVTASMNNEEMQNDASRSGSE